MPRRTHLVRNVIDDVGLCIGFYTRIPVRQSDAPVDFAGAQWAAPLIGGLIGVFGACLFSVLHSVGVSVSLSAVLTISALILLTGALHEDGLADVADGFGGGLDPERKLEIMKDSRIGTYGVLALIGSFAIRSFALVEIANPVQVTGALIAAHAASRAILPAFMGSLKPARSSGLARGVGPLPGRSIIIALLIGFVGLLAASPMVALISICLLAFWFVGFRFLSRTQINGHTGDVLGALQQGGETIVLVTASILLV